MNEALRIGVALEANLIEQVRYFGKSPLVNFYDETNMTRMATGLPVATLNLIAGVRLSENYLDQAIEDKTGRRSIHSNRCNLTGRAA